MSYRHPRWYDYGKTDEQLEREANGVFWLLILAAPFTFGATLIAAIFVVANYSTTDNGRCDCKGRANTALGSGPSLQQHRPLPSPRCRPPLWEVLPFLY